MTVRNSPKVALVVATDRLSGAENRVVKIYRALRARDYPVELWIKPGLRRSLESRYPRLAKEAVEYCGGGTIVRFLRPFQRSRILWSLVDRSRIPERLGNSVFERQLSDRRIDLAHIFLDTQIAHIRNRPTIFELTSPDIADLMGTRPARWRASHTAYHAVSPGVARRFSALAPELPLFEAPGPFFETGQAEMRHVEKENTVIFAHRFLGRKNGALFATVACQFVRERPEWKVRILGAGEEEAEIRKIVEGMGDRIEVGFDPDLPSALARSRVFVSLIQPDNFPSQSVMEAMSAGNALVLSDTGDSAEKFLDGNGVLTSLNQEQVRRSLLLLTQQPVKLAQMGDRSRELARARFDVGSYLDHLSQLYELIASGSS